jgi:hypothetical protein
MWAVDLSIRMINGLFVSAVKLWFAGFSDRSRSRMPPCGANGWQDEIRGKSCAWNWELTQVSDIPMAGLAGNLL